MALTPLDIHNKEFGRAFRGYKEDEVDEFLDEIVKDMEGYIKENVRLKEEVDKNRANVDQYKKLEQTLNNTLLVAQETADEVKASAKKEADMIIRETEMKAEKIIDEAKEQAKKIAEQNEVVRLETELLKTRLRTLLQSQLDLLESKDTPSDEEAANSLEKEPEGQALDNETE